MNYAWNRRDWLRLAGGAVVGSGLGIGGLHASAEGEPGADHKGCIVGQPEGARAGEEVLAAGGNAVDAVVAAALVAGVVAVQQCGIGGYGGHMVIALAGGKVTAIDFNSAAPRAARPDMFAATDRGGVKEHINEVGWLAAGVPGTLAGMQLALDRYGTQSFRRLVQPALRYARDGFKVSTQLANAIKGLKQQLARDPGSARLLLDRGEPLRVGSTYRNPDLAAMLQTLAERNSVESFYRGDIAQKIAAAFSRHGGLVTTDDLAAYHAREVAPLELTWRNYALRTAPLTAGGLTVLEALGVLKALKWEARPYPDPRTAHATVETLRLVWADRLRYLGDPEKATVPTTRLLSPAYARQLAARVDTAVRDGKVGAAQSDGRTAGGTVHLNAADPQGNLVALTLTHGTHFGAKVTVDGLGLILGHGMSRFDPRPGRPNSPGPGKRPLHNMCPTVLLRDGHPVIALGGTGGRKIPNAIFDVLAQLVGREASLEQAVAAPRLHTEGGLDLTAEARWPEAEVAYLKKIGYRVRTGPSATVHAVAFDPQSRRCRAVSR